MTKTTKLSTLSLTACLAFAGCVADPGADADEPATDTAAQDIGLPSPHREDHSFGGSLFSTPFNYVTEQLTPAGNCTAGYRRPAQPDVHWTSQAGGFCMFTGWNTTDIHDCRAQIQGSTGGGGFGGDCLTTVAEVVETMPTPTTPQGAYSYTASATSSAQLATGNRQIQLTAGQTLVIGTCGVVGSSFSGDTYLRLFDQNVAQVAANDDACSGLGSQITYTAPNSQRFEIHAGCYASTSCSGTVSWTIQ